MTTRPWRSASAMIGSISDICPYRCTGNTAFVCLSAYPDVNLTLLDEDPELLAIARDKLSVIREDIEVLHAPIAADGEPLAGGPYDVVLAIDGEAVVDAASAGALLRSFRPGDTVALTVLRDDAEREVPLVLAGPAEG